MPICDASRRRWCGWRRTWSCNRRAVEASLRRQQSAPLTARATIGGRTPRTSGITLCCTVLDMHARSAPRATTIPSRHRGGMPSEPCPTTRQPGAAPGFTPTRQVRRRPARRRTTSGSATAARALKIGSHGRILPVQYDGEREPWVARAESGYGPQPEVGDRR